MRGQRVGTIQGRQEQTQQTPRAQQAAQQPAQREVSYVSNITLPSGRRQQVRIADADSQSALRQMLEELTAAKARAM